ncbi:hypothetical protein K502DRAFT_343435 [Neoconidiobolus thromboides FSU 785]|nr:hypothetical protein K502DRAFT_343435 [Neoconidiobolus thromboides FSU 785]
MPNTSNQGTELKHKERNVLDMTQKLEIIRLHKAGSTNQYISNMFNIGRSTVSKIITNKERLLTLSEGVENDLRKRVRKNEFNILEKRVIEWCTKDAEKDEQGFLKLAPDYDSDKIIMKAQKIANELNQSHFIADTLWLSKLRRKFKLKFKIPKKQLSSLTIKDTNIIKSNVPDDFTLPSLTDYQIYNEIDNDIDIQFDDYIF